MYFKGSRWALHFIPCNSESLAPSMTFMIVSQVEKTQLKCSGRTARLFGFLWSSCSSPEQFAREQTATYEKSKLLPLFEQIARFSLRWMLYPANIRCKFGLHVEAHETARWSKS